MDADAQRRAVWCEVGLRASLAARARYAEGCGRKYAATVWPGDVVTVRRCDFAELQPRQIVLHGYQEKLTLHRIARIAGDHLITRGDSLPHYDPPVMPSEILGQVVSIFRGGRTIDPEQTFWQRVAASILQRSRFLRRFTLYLSRQLRRSRDMRTLSASSSPQPAGK